MGGETHAVLLLLMIKWLNLYENRPAEPPTCLAETERQCADCTMHVWHTPPCTRHGQCARETLLPLSLALSPWALWLSICVYTLCPSILRPTSNRNRNPHGAISWAHGATYFLKTSAALWPPKPRLSVTATSSSPSANVCATLGT